MMRCLVVILALTLSQSGFAQEDLVPNDMKSIVTEKELPMGWTPNLKLSANLSLNSSTDVIGQPDGDTFTGGASLDGGYNFRATRREWRNEFLVKAASTRTPSLPQYVTSTDDLQFTSIYLHSLESYPKVGPYARLNLETNLFKGEDVRSEPTIYSVEGSQQATNTLRLTDPFRPLTLKESVGFFSKPIDEKGSKLEFRLGVGAIQVWADDQLAVQDDSATPVIEVIRLEDYEQVGLEGAAEWNSSIDEVTSYKFAVEFLTPFGADLPAGDDRSEIELTNYEVLFKIDSKMYKWMSLSYEMKIKKQPQLLDKEQVQQMILLNLSQVLL